MAVMETVDAHLITQFNDMMNIKAQQIRARMKNYVDIKRMTGDVFAYDGIGTVEAREIHERFATVVFDNIEHFRRRMLKRRFVLALPMDSNDISGMLRDPSGIYATECVKAMERVFDRVVYDAVFASVDTGRNFDTSVSFSSDGGFTVNATGGLTYPKMLEADQNWIDAEVGNDMPIRKGFFISGDEHTAMMQLLQLTSGDYTRQVVVDQGEITRALGWDVVKYGANARTPLLTVSSGTRNCLLMAAGAMMVGMVHDLHIEIEKRPDKHQTKQLIVETTLGAVRKEGNLVQKFQTTD